MIEIAICMVCFTFGVGIGWKQREKDSARDADLNARAIIEQSLNYDPKVFERVLRRVK